MKMLNNISQNNSSEFLLADLKAMENIDIWLLFNKPSQRFLNLYKDMILLPVNYIKKKSRIYQILTTYMVKKERN